jgi:hypothetical protein
MEVVPTKVDTATQFREDFGFLPPISEPNISSGLNSIENIGSIPVTESPAFTAIPITFPLPIYGDDYGSHLEIDKGHIVFSKSTINDVEFNRYTSFNIPHLNFQFELNTRKKAAKEGVIIPRFKKPNLGRLEDDFDSSLVKYDEFIQNWVYAGICLEGCAPITNTGEAMSTNSFANKTGRRGNEKTLTMACSYRTRIPNLWPGCKKGHLLFLGLKSYEWRYDKYTDSLGVSHGNPTPGEYLQIYPVPVNRTRFPNNMSSSDEPNATDIAFYEDAEEKVIHYNRLDRYGLPDTSQSEEVDSMEYRKLRQGKSFLVGMVWSSRGNPSTNDVKKAMRSTRDWNALLNQCPLEVILSSSPEFPLSDYVN